MRSSIDYLNPAEAARRLGVSPKALRLYEQRGLVAPVRTAAGWRAYGPDQMARAAEVVALRGLGLSLARIADVLGGDAKALEPALAGHQTALEHQVRRIAGALDRVRDMRASLALGRMPAAGDLAGLLTREAGPAVAFDLPWPWGGERFELRVAVPLTYITGPLGSGKTRLAQAVAEAWPGAIFLGPDRSAQAPSDPAHAVRVDRTLAWLVEDGAAACDALRGLVIALEADGPAPLIVDMPEQGLDQAGQSALIAHLRGRGTCARPLILLTRSSTILDLAAVGPDETILYCPANHAPPVRVAPYPGAPGYESVATCLASPPVRARTEGMMAVMSQTERSAPAWS